MIEEVEYYINHILEKQLLDCGLKSNQLILDSVRNQMYSLLSHWNEEELRNTILLTGLEEGSYYLPEANNLVRSFVVVTIRNSYLESAGSNFYKQYGFEKQISDHEDESKNIKNEMKMITSRAIQYFKELDFTSLATQIHLKKEEDYYLNILTKYPDSYQVLKRLANTKKNEEYFEKLKVTKCSNLCIQGMNTAGDRKKLVTEDGYSREIGLELTKALQTYLQQNIPFITHSFKYITRNFEKLLRFLQCLLENDLIYVSSNYYISNGYVSKRKKLRRVPHTDQERKLNFIDMTGLSKRHAKAINIARKEHRI